MNPFEQAVKRAVKNNELFNTYFSAVGIGDNRRGFVATAYRSAQMAMREALKQPNKVAAARDVMGSLRLALHGGAYSLFQQAQGEAVQDAEVQLALYDDVQAAQVNSETLSEQRLSAVCAVLAKVDAQTAFIDAALMAGQDDDLILGDEDRAGALRPGDVLAASAFWVAALFWDAWQARISLDRYGSHYQKVAVAALDNRTTDCCLRLHGQVQPFEKPFHLEGTPRFADELDWSPFHYYCRTSIALYLPEYDDGIAGRMQLSASMVLDERANGMWIDRDPVGAFIS